jgi:ATP-binding cassette subfamily B protein RaxB
MLKIKNRLPIFLQSEMTECGLACLAMIFTYHGTTISLSELRRHFNVSQKGITLQQLKQVAQLSGFKTNVLRLDIHQLASVKLPCILHWDLNHFVVLKSFDEKQFVIHDPARGLRSISYDHFDKSFTGVVLELIPEQVRSFLKKKKPDSGIILRQLFKDHLVSFIKLVCLSGLIQILYIAAIQLIQRCLDNSLNHFQPKWIVILLAAFFGFKLVEISAIATRTILITSVGSLINRDFGMFVKKHLLSLPISFFENRHVGDVLSRFGAIEKIRSTLTEGVVEGLIDGLVSIIMLIVMIYTNHTLSIIVVFFSLLYFVSRFFHNQKSRQLNEEALYARAIELSHFMETIRGILPIKLFSKTNDRLRTWSNKFIIALNSSNRIVWHKLKFDVIKNLFFGTDLTLVLFIGCFFISDKMLSIGVLYAFISYRQQFILSITNLTDKFQNFYLLRLHIERLNDIVAEETEYKNEKILIQPILRDKKLLLNNISFTYPGDEKPVLENMTLTISPNECVAITGPSGCGKTTLLKILMGFLPPSQGQLYLDDIPVYPNYVASYRQTISGVLQNDLLFSGTMIDNISFFDSKVNMDRVYQCAKLAGIFDEIQLLPMGFNTLIGDMGSVLSGGQKQRVILARALYSQPTILFLDEASSHLDIAKEREINQNIKSLGLTIVMIAHRLETIQMADRIIKLF